jgi:hypothetical protein
VQKKEIRGGKG